jgi:hypothetical protein
MLPRSWSDWFALGWLAACALSVLLALAAPTYPVWRMAGWTSSLMILLGGPLAVFLMAERFLRGVREVGGYGWPLALLCLTAVPVAGLLIAGQLFALP